MNTIATTVCKAASPAGYGTNVIGAEVYPGPKRIYVDSLAGISGETRLHLLFTPPPANDAFTNRITLPSAPVKVSGRTYAATWDPNHIYVSRGAWWEWTAPSSGLWTLRPAQWDGTLLLETAPISTMSDAGAFSDNATSTSAKPVAFRAEAGQRFAVLASTIDGGFGGNVSFAIDQAVAPPVTGQLEYEPWASRVSWHIRWPGNDGLAKVVETSTDLIHWGPLPANSTVVEGDASLPFVDSESERFFRARIDAARTSGQVIDSIRKLARRPLAHAAPGAYQPENERQLRHSFRGPVRRGVRTGAGRTAPGRDAGAATGGAVDPRLGFTARALRHLRPARTHRSLRPDACRHGRRPHYSAARARGAARRPAPATLHPDDCRRLADRVPG